LQGLDKTKTKVLSTGGAVYIQGVIKARGSSYDERSINAVIKSGKDVEIKKI
jgi:hypothetical protein